MRLILSKQKPITFRNGSGSISHNATLNDWYDYLHDPTDNVVWHRKERVLHSMVGGGIQRLPNLPQNDPLYGIPLLTHLPSNQRYKSLAREIYYGNAVLLQVGQGIKAVGLWDGERYQYSLDACDSKTFTPKGRVRQRSSEQYNARNLAALFGFKFDLTHLQDKLLSPIVVVTYTNEPYRYNSITLDANLKRFGYFDCDPNQLVQELDMWLAGRDYTDPNQGVLSDKDKAKKAGHGHAYSFRKMPSE